MAERQIFIVGTGRSGTTILRKVLVREHMQARIRASMKIVLEEIR